MSTHLLLPMFETYPLVMCLLSFMLFLTICFKRCLALEMMMSWWIGSVMSSLNTIGMSMQRTNLTLLAILFIALRHWMKFG
ncbi:hypothetical protein ACHAW6_016105 [Cyclotella cf. meneghiniana]